jgi:hypothetical protein
MWFSDELEFVSLSTIVVLTVSIFTTKYPLEFYKDWKRSYFEPRPINNWYNLRLFRSKLLTIEPLPQVHEDCYIFNAD